MKKFLVSVATVAVIVASGVRADAATIVFDNAGNHPGGTITATPAGLLITNGVIDLVTRVSPAPLVSFPVSGTCGVPGNPGGATFGCLGLVTGAFIGQAADNPDRYLFSSTGAGVLITGSADGAVNTALYAGIFDPATNVSITFDRMGGVLTGTGSITGTLGLGMLNPSLAAALGVSSVVVSGTDTNNFVSFNFSAAPNGTGSLTTHTVQLLTLEQVSVPLPEPGLMMLLGTGLFGVASAARRRITKSRNAAKV